MSKPRPDFKSAINPNHDILIDLDTSYTMVFLEDEFSAKDKTYHQIVDETKIQTKDLFRNDVAFTEKFIVVDEGTINCNDQVATPVSNATIDTVALIGKVAATAHLHKSQQYLDALRHCCMHDLRFDSCKRQSCPGRKSRLCIPFRKQLCPSTHFQHDHFVHILQSCVNALDTGECYDIDCSLGHDNLELRTERYEERKTEVLVNLAKQKVIADIATCKQLKTLQIAMDSNATAYEIHKEEEVASKLEKKIRSKQIPGGQNVITGQLRVKVKSTLKLYAQSQGNTA
jgi:hypothetical protein